MDADFLSELDKAISTIGTDKVWDRTVGGIKFMLSPVSYEAQGKINEAMASQETGSNALNEAKRITLSYAIVGINNNDLREYRDAGAVFPVKNREGKPVKVVLEKYLYEKSAKWGGQLIDDLFSVYADLMESFQKENLKEITFENAKNPVEELGELMVRVTELREQLRLPALIEPDDERFLQWMKTAKAKPDPEEPAVDKEVAEKAEKAAEGMEESFDPFKAMPQPPPEAPVQRVVRHVVPNTPPQPRPPTPDELDAPAATAPTASSPAAPHQPRFNSGDVIEERGEQRPPVKPPVVDSAPRGNINPRFAKPAR